MTPGLGSRPGSCIANPGQSSQLALLLSFHVGFQLPWHIQLRFQSGQGFKFARNRAKSSAVTVDLAFGKPAGESRDVSSKLSLLAMNPAEGSANARNAEEP